MSKRRIPAYFGIAGFIALTINLGLHPSAMAQMEPAQRSQPVVDAERRTVTVGKGITFNYPTGWAPSAQKYANAVELVAKGRSRIILVPDARMLITTEQRLSHAEAIQRLQQIAASRTAVLTYLAISGWPTFQRRYREPLPLPTDHFVQPGPPNTKRAEGESRLAYHSSTVIAAGNTIVRLETTVSPTAGDGLALQAIAWARLARLPLRTDRSQTEAEVKLLRAEKPAPESDPASFPPESYRQWGPSSLTATLVGGGSETEAAVSADGRSMIVGSNSGVQVSGDAGATFTLAPSATLPFPNQGDPSVAIGRSGNYYFANLGLPGSLGPLALTGLTACTASVMSAGSNGATFTLAGNAASCAASTMCFPDQEHIAADRTNASPRGGDQVYAVWRNLTPYNFLGLGLPANCAGVGSAGFGSSSTPAMSCSVDSGSNWSAAVVAGSGDYPRLAVGSDGFVYVAIRDGGDVVVHKFTSCANGLFELPNSPKRVFSGINDTTCPLPGLDRCHNGLIVPTVAVDDTSPTHVFAAVQRSASGISANDDILVADSNDGGLSWSVPVRVNAPVTARRFMPWLCAISGNAYVGWYDRRAAVVLGAASNDLTDYFLGSVAVRNGQLQPDGERNLTGAPEPQCASGWPLGLASPDNSNDSESCSVQPQLAGTCLPGPPPPAMPIACDFSSGPACPSGSSCKTGSGAPKYGDYNGIACGGDTVLSTWASATPPTGFAGMPPGFITVFSDAEKIIRSLTITEWTLPSGDPGHFDLKIDGALAAAAVSNASAGPFTQATGSHAVSESPSSPTVMSDYSTTISGDCDQDGAVHFSALHSATCTITNLNKSYSSCANRCSSTESDCWNGNHSIPGCVTTCVNRCAHPTLTISKQLSPAGDPGKFDLQVDGVTRKSNVGNGGTIPSLVLATGQHVVTEVAVPGTTSSNYTVTFSGDCDASGKITLGYGDSKQCQIANFRKPGTGQDAHLTLKKILKPSTDPGRFNLQIDGATVASAVGDGGTSGSTIVLAGPHVVGESGTAGTSLGDYNTTISGDCSASGRVTLAAGDNKICTITNHKRNRTCEIACNTADYQCMQTASSYVERQGCVSDLTSCMADCAQN
jgi:hypothetical protein